MAQRYCYNHLLHLFDSEEHFIKHCVEVVSCRYIAKALQVLEHDRRGLLSREEYKHILNQCKVVSIEKQAKRRLDEIYLGKSSFFIELVRSFSEFTAVVVKTLTLGFLPYDFKYESN